MEHAVVALGLVAGIAATLVAIGRVAMNHAARLLDDVSPGPTWEVTETKAQTPTDTHQDGGQAA